MSAKTQASLRFDQNLEGFSITQYIHNDIMNAHIIVRAYDYVRLLSTATHR